MFQGIALCTSMARRCINRRVRYLRTIIAPFPLRPIRKIGVRYLRTMIFSEEPWHSAFPRTAAPWSPQSGGRPEGANEALNYPNPWAQRSAGSGPYRLGARGPRPQPNGAMVRSSGPYQLRARNAKATIRMGKWSAGSGPNGFSCIRWVWSTHKDQRAYQCGKV